MSLPILRRIDHKHHKAIDAAIADGFDFIGTRVTYALEIPENHFPVEIREARKADYDAVLAIVLAEMRHSRIYADRRIPFEAAQQVYRERVKLAFAIATVVVAVHIGKEGIVGFCSLQENEIDLIAVAKEHQRKRIGRKLVEYCIDVCASRGDKKVVVKTQGSNYPARNLYAKLGFLRTKIEKDFHKPR